MSTQRRYSCSAVRIDQGDTSSSAGVAELAELPAVVKAMAEQANAGIAWRNVQRARQWLEQNKPHEAIL